MPKVIYISSMGHSGSTLLDIILGNIPGLFSTGELTNLFLQIYRHQQGDNISSDLMKKISQYIRVNYAKTHCSCMKEFCDCPVWKKIMDNLSVKIGYDIWQNPMDYRIYFPPFGKCPPSFYAFGKIQRKVITMSYSRLIFHPFKLLLDFFAKSIAQNNWRLFDAISEETGCNFIVDSSKDIQRFDFLSKSRPDSIYLFILLRDILGVTASYKKLGKNPLRTAYKWVNEYKRIDSFLKKNRTINCHLINYGNLVCNTEIELNKVYEYLGITLRGASLSLNTENHHVVGGNKMRFSGSIKIKKDESWKTILTREEIRQINDIKKRFNFLEQYPQ